MDEELKQQIVNARRMSADNKLVTYDLTNGVDFHHPRRTAEVLAQVFFEQDASKWFTAEGKDVTFKPLYKAKILISEEHNKKVNATMDDFFNDLRKDELKNKFPEQIEAAATYRAGLGTYIFAGIIGSLIIENSERNSEMDSYVRKLLDDIRANTEIQAEGTFS